MIIPCECGRPKAWELSRAGEQPILMSKCHACNPLGPWETEPVEVVRKPRGKAPETIPLAWAPVDDPNSNI